MDINKPLIEYCILRATRYNMHSNLSIVCRKKNDDFYIYERDWGGYDHPNYEILTILNELEAFIFYTKIKEHKLHCYWDDIPTKPKIRVKAGNYKQYKENYSLYCNM
jgi:hypothetical protein